MKDTDIAKIRQHLKDIIEITNINPENTGDRVYRNLANKALALLPCSTCNGSEIKKPESGCGECLAGDGNCRADCPCPNCQS